MNARVMDEGRGPFGKNIREPRDWPYDGGNRVEEIVDANWLIDGKPRVIRRVGWRREGCMCCGKKMWSCDLARVRMCETCKGTPLDKSSYG